MSDSPAFGQADLTNCERELIHLAGSVQPHGVLLVLRAADLVIEQASANTEMVWGVAAAALLGQPLAVLGADLPAQVSRLAGQLQGDEPLPLRAQVTWQGRTRAGEGAVHRHLGGGLVVELEPLAPPAPGQPEPAGLPGAQLNEAIAQAVQRFGGAATINGLADAVVQVFRDLTGYDRVMVYKFDPDGHGKIIAEARDPRLESLLGHHYPATDIPQRARELYLRNRARVLVDVNYHPAPLVPPRGPDGRELDMSMCALRSMSPLHLQYLRNMGVTGTLVVSLVRDGRLWGLVAAHHYAPRNLRLSLRLACELLAEVVSTRIAAIENYAHAQVAILVRRLEQRLVEATSTEGDWRLALLRNPRTLLQPLEATGAILFQDDEILTTGEVPSTPEMRALLAWVHAQHTDDAPFACGSVAQANPALASLTPVASGVLAVRLANDRPDYLMWLRKEQLLTVTWAGDPHKPMVGDDPLELSPRRSFAAWSEIVRGTALPWSGAELALARAIGGALVDIIVQVHAVRLLIAEQQLARIRATVAASQEPVALAEANGRLLFVNPRFVALVGGAEPPLATLGDVAARFAPSAALREGLASLGPAGVPWRGEVTLRGPEGRDVPLVLRAEAVPGRDGRPLGFIVTLTDLSSTKATAAARAQLEDALRLAAGGSADGTADEVIHAILTNASVAAMDIADGPVGAAVAPLLQELQAATQRASSLYGQLRDFED